MNKNGLLNLLETSGEQQCRDLRSEGATKVAELRRKAFARARQRVSAAIAEERKRMDQAIGRVEAEVETTLRQRLLAHDAALVEQGRRVLIENLQRRWQDPDARSAWAATLVDEAANVVIARDWRVECPNGWPGEEQAELARRAAEAHGARVEIVPSDSLEAGLKLVSGGLVVDMSLAGLLVDEDFIDGALLDLVGRASAGEAS
ncbi:hypothetical protein [Wenzhouxiangella limi]|uniref:Uncharacterized protein n=1 Tax=Wenzhouxiangella limi TaxID=2707351 RepID=A0A845VIS9_9GAMM|nr:hypothetical protein [Wenzhouxiangella limi]NDY97079.1 hypothetical protein [Wenzhouxiangella limi]